MFLGYSKISHKLFVMHRLQLFHRFKFYYHRFLDKDVESEIYRKYNTIIHDIKFHLILDSKSFLAQLMTQSRFVYRFE